jgi:hypothetical protein
METTYTEILVGFDAREMYLDFTATWEKASRDRFLLKQDILKPLSTDVMIWNSVFHKKPSIEFSGGFLQISLAEVKNRLADASTHPDHSYGLIAITKWVRNAEVGEYYPIEWPEDSQSWSLLGYDISDFVCLSGLTNCGYRDEESQQLKAAWADKLNQYHLFTDVQAAFAFKDMTDQRVREHSPFSVYGLYLIEKFDIEHTGA